MSDDFSLFDLPCDQPKKAAETRGAPIRDEQVQHIREAFQSAGIDEQSERKALIESVASRPVASLRELLAVEASLVLGAIRKLANAKPAQKSSGSAWDDREEDTWIDKL